MSGTIYQVANTSIVAAGTVVSTPAAATGYSVDNLSDGRPSIPLLQSAAAANATIVVDGQLLTNGGFETTTLANWTNADSGTGASTDGGADARTGSHCLKLRPGATGVAADYQDVTVPAGALLQLTAWAKETGATDWSIRVRNLQTGNYLAASAGSWQASATGVKAVSDASYVQSTILIPVESYATCRAHTVTLRIWMYATANKTYYVDDVELVMGATWSVVAGHNVEPGIALTVDSSPDNSSWTTRSTPTVIQPSFYGTFAIVYARYWRLLFTGTPTTAIWIGEWVLGCYSTLTRPPDAPWRSPWAVTWTLPQLQSQTRQGDLYRTNLSAHAPRRLGLPWTHGTSAEFLEWRRELLERTAWGRDALVLAPWSTEDTVVHGRVAPEAQVSRTYYDSTTPWRSSVAIEIAEDPFPLQGA